MKDSKLEFTGVITKNSIEFVETVFALNRQHKPVMLLRAADDERVRSFCVAKTIVPGDSTGWAQLPFESQASDNIAQVSFTSGTEGRPKGILLTYRNQADMVERLNGVMHLDATVREYIGIPVYHSFGFGRCRLVSSVGGAFYLPPQGFDPVEIQSMLELGQINAISAVPSLWRVLLECSDIFGAETHNVKWIEIGSQYMSAAEKQQLKALFPKAIIVQHYGLTEASRATFLEIHKAPDDALESVGCVVGDTQIKCTAEGRIAICGSVVAQAMVKDGQEITLVDEDGWFITNDLGELKNGYLFYKGRADDMINCGGIKLYAEAIEKELRQQLRIAKGIACTKFNDVMRGEGVLVVYERNLGVELVKLQQALEHIMVGAGVHARNAVKLEAIDQIPVTDTGKVQRKKITELFTSQTTLQTLVASSAGSSALPHEVSSAERLAQLQQLWQDILGLDSVGIHESFADLGGDSLTAISAIFKMKKMGVPAHISRGILQGKTIAQLVGEELGDTVIKPALIADDALQIKVVRGLLVLMVIFAHWSEGFLARLPDSVSWVSEYLAPFFAAGTPGFAVMYGVAIGFSFLPLYIKSPERLQQLVKPILWVLAAGIAVLAGVRILMLFMEGRELTSTVFFNSFYGVLTYYFLATLALRPLFYILRQLQNPVLGACIMAVLLHLLYLVYCHPLTLLPAFGVVEFGKLLIAAKYSFFNMSSGMLIGLALGYALATNKGERALTTRSKLLLALGTICLAWLLSVVSGDAGRWLEWPTATVPAWRWALYFGSCLLLMLGIEHLCAKYPSKLLAHFVEVLACIGLLAFPLYVLHELVLPLKNILELLGVPNSVALLGLISFFAIGASVMVIRSRRLLFA